MPVNAVSLCGLSFAYHGNDVLKDITCNIVAGDYVGIVGPNGSGKSTLMRCILGLNRPYAGSITLFRRPPRILHRLGAESATCPRDCRCSTPAFPQRFGKLSGSADCRQNAFRNASTRMTYTAVDKALELMAISDIGNRLIGELSGGLRQRTILARALVNEPELLILDEPTTALDPDTRESFYATLQDLNRNRGTTVLFVTHDSATIGLYASRLLYLDKKIVFYGDFGQFCESAEMTSFFGQQGQHLICHRH